MDNTAPRISAYAKHLRDPRYYQIAVLSSLLSFGIVGLDFNIAWQNALVILATAQVVQFVASKLAGLARFDALSAVITSLSLTLLLRTDSIGIAALAATIAIGSKFLIRIRRKHVFNPANVAIVTLTLGTGHAWITTGQWGNATIGALALACLGFLVLTRAKRAETTIAFLVAFTGLLFGRAIWLGDPLAIPIHQLQNGALLIFAFFMISDPKTSPDTRLGRVAYGALVASVAYYFQFVLYETGAAILALIVCAPLVPLIDAVLRGRKYEWTSPANGAAGQAARS